MENSIERPIRKTAKVCFEKVEYNEKIKEFEADGNKKVLPGYGIIMPEGEMSIKLDEHTSIRENGVTLSRFDNALERIMASKSILVSEAERATEKFMEEKGLTSIKEIIEQSKITNIEQKEEEQDRVG